MLEWLRFIIVALFMTAGIAIIVLATLGVYRFHFVLNRMHSAAMGDTLGILFIILGLMVANGFTLALFKLLCIIIFMWIASPVSSHLITKLEYLTNDRLSKICHSIDKTQESASVPADSSVPDPTMLQDKEADHGNL